MRRHGERGHVDAMWLIVFLLAVIALVLIFGRPYWR